MLIMRQTAMPETCIKLTEIVELHLSYKHLGQEAEVQKTREIK